MPSAEHRGDGTVRSAVEADTLVVDVLGYLRTGPGGLPRTCARRVAGGTCHLGDERSIVAALLPNVVEVPPFDAEHSVAHPVEPPRVRRPGGSVGEYHDRRPRRRGNNAQLGGSRATGARHGNERGAVRCRTASLSRIDVGLTRRGEDSYCS
jgi:hypothetical protein